MMTNSQLIVALDCEQLAQALSWASQLDPEVCAVKIGSELFTRCGEELVRVLVARQFKVFLDLKFHDIPHTVARACTVAADLGVWMLDVHASGGLAMMQAAVHALKPFGVRRPLLIGVTVLTSFDDTEFSRLGVAKDISEHTLHLACLAQQAGLDGVVSAAADVPLIKAACGAAFLTVTPGIRCLDDALHDQLRVVTPQQAKQLGSDYLVVGRSITKATDIAQRVRDILHHLA